MSTNQIETPVRAGIFETLPEAEAAVHNLKAAGFSASEITVIGAEEHMERHVSPTKESQPEPTAHMEEGVALGSGLGFGLGAITAAGIVATGGLPIIAAGAMIGLGITGTLIGAFTSRGVEKEVANFYDQSVRKGHILVSVEVHGDDAPDRLFLAEKVIHDSGARPIQLPEG